MSESRGSQERSGENRPTMTPAEVLAVMDDHAMRLESVANECRAELRRPMHRALAEFRQARAAVAALVSERDRARAPLLERIAELEAERDAYAASDRIKTANLAAIAERAPAGEPVGEPVALPDGLVERCREVIGWQRTGILTGEALRSLAATMYDADGLALQRAEEQTKREAMQFVLAAALSQPVTPKPCSEATPDNTKRDAQDVVTVTLVDKTGKVVTSALIDSKYACAAPVIVFRGVVYKRVRKLNGEYEYRERVDRA